MFGQPLKWALLGGGSLSVLVLHAVAVLKLHDVAPPESNDILRLVSGFVSVDGRNLWQPVQLPDDWMVNHPGTTDAWYRLPFRLRQDAYELSAVYVPALAQNAAVYVNGRAVGDGGRSTPPIARNWPRPLFFPVPAGLLRAGQNEVSIHVASEPVGTGLLGGIYFGPREALLPFYERRYALKYTAPVGFVVILVILAAMVATITFRRPQDSIYLWFAAILLALACYALPMLVVDIPVSTRAWDWFRAVSIGWAAFFIVGATHRFIAARRPRTERAALITFLGGSIVIAFVPADVYHRYAGMLWGCLCLGWGLYACASVARWLAQRPRTDGLLLMCTGVSLLFFGGRDALMVAGLLPRLDGYLIHYASPAVALVLTWVLLSEFVDARRQSEILNRQLADRVRHKSAERDDYHDRLRESEQSKAIMQERDRIMRDMHDGVGGHLASALALLERRPGSSERAIELLRQATEDLRLVVHSLDPAGEVLSEVLGLLRPRLQRQCDAAGVDLRWEVLDTAPVVDMGPEKALQVMRIVQEAVANAIRHAGARIVAVSCRDQGDTVLLEIVDDGSGMDDDSVRAAGCGLDNMRFRAERIGADIRFKSGPDGTAVAIHLQAA